MLLEQETINVDDVVKLIGERPHEMPVSHNIVIHKSMYNACDAVANSTQHTRQQSYKDVISTDWDADETIEDTVAVDLDEVDTPSTCDPAAVDLDEVGTPSTDDPAAIDLDEVDKPSTDK